MAKKTQPPINQTAIGDHNIQVVGSNNIIQKFFNFIMPVGLEQQRAQRNRQAMLELVKNIWVKGVLEKSLYAEVLIDLGLEARADAVECPWDMVVQTPNQPDRPLPHGAKLVQIFDEMNHALLILGEPGAGKTTLLLELAREAITRAEADLTKPIPVVFNLSSWTDPEQPLADWLIDELNTKYNIQKKIASLWVENDDLLLLLDGLDEVKAENREDCVKAINKFRSEHGLAPLAVCSRLADYETLLTRLKLQGAVLVQPLTLQQIDAYFEKVGSELEAVSNALHHDATLQELAGSPLTLSIMTLAYRGASAESMQLGGTTEASRKHLFDIYIQRMFKRRGVDRHYTPEQTVYWLAWLAQRMIEREQSIFLLEQMRRDWLPTRMQRRLYQVFVNSMAWLPISLVVALVVGLVIGFSKPIWGLLAGLGSLLFLGRWAGFKLDDQYDFELAEVLKWSWKNPKRVLYFVQLIGLAFGLIGLGDVILLLRVWLVDGLIMALRAWLAFGLFGLMGLLLYLVFGLTRAEIEMKTRPNQGVWQSMKNYVLVGPAFGLTFGLTFGLSTWLADWQLSRLLFGLGLGLTFGLTFGLFWGGGAVISHYVLRCILYNGGYIPLDYVRFLDYAAGRILLRKVGGGYIFVHRMLMEHFAQMASD